MTRSSVQVFLRSRPSSVPNPLVQFLSDRKTVVISIPKSDKGYAAQGTAGNQYQFKFDGVLHEASQEDVFEAAAADVLRSALDGCNGTVMCYGQTGAGKTYTMSGGRQNFKQRGLIPRVLTQLFADIKSRPHQDTRVSISYLEIYNEQLYDLLDITTQPHEVQVQDISASRGQPGALGTAIRVTGLRIVAVDSEAEAMKLLFEGETNRVIGEHQLNRESSRSHSIFQISLETRTRNDPLGVMTSSKLSLVDLAGSERVSKTRSEGTVLREAGHINKSLSILEQVILAISERGRDHVPFRSSRLTHVLRDSLGGNCLTALVANIWGESDQIDETLSTCRFAQRMMKVTCEVSPNVVEDNSAKVRQLQRQVGELQQELALHDSMSGRQGVTYAPYTPQQRAMLQAQLDLFLDSDDPDSVAPLELVSLRHVREAMCCLRARLKERLVEADRAMAEAQAAAAVAARAAAAGFGPGGSGNAGVGAGAGRAVGGNGDAGEPLSPTSAMAARLAAPEAVGPASSSQQQEQGVGEGGGDAGAGEAQGDGAGTGARAGERALGGGREGRPGVGGKPGGSGPGRPKGEVPDQQAAFDEFKSSDGAVKTALLDENRARLKAAKKKAKELGLGINSAKRELDALKTQSDTLRSARQARGAEAAQVLDAEELDTLNRIKQYKKQYKDQFGELQMVRSEVDYTQQLCDTCAQEIVTDFQTWYLDTYGVTLASESSHPATSAGADLPLDDLCPPSPSASTASTSAASPTASVRSQGLLGSATRPSPPQATGKAGPVTGAGRKVGAGAGAAALTPTLHHGGAAAAARLPAIAPQPEPGELTDPEAAAFYLAQQAMMARTQAVLHRPGSVKKKVGPNTTFSNTNRADITAKTTADAFVKPDAVTRSPQAS